MTGHDWVVVLGDGTVSVPWTSHTTEVGAQRMVASLNRSTWQHQSPTVRTRWRFAPSYSPDTAVLYADRAAALAATDVLVVDDITLPENGWWFEGVPAAAAWWAKEPSGHHVNVYVTTRPGTGDHSRPLAGEFGRVGRTSEPYDVRSGTTPAYRIVALDMIRVLVGDRACHVPAAVVDRVLASLPDTGDVTWNVAVRDVIDAITTGSHTLDLRPDHVDDHSPTPPPSTTPTANQRPTPKRPRRSTPTTSPTAPAASDRNVRTPEPKPRAGPRPPVHAPGAASGRTGRSGRKPLVPLSPAPSVGDNGRAVGEVAALFDDWLLTRQATNRIRSSKTIDGYRDDMARWATLLAGTGDTPAWDRFTLAHLTGDRLVAGLSAMNTAGLSVSARQRSLAPLRGLCRWLVRTGRLVADPTNNEDLEVRSSPSSLPSSFSDDELARIVTVAADGIESQREQLRWPDRDIATIALLAGAGLRSSELCGLKWSAFSDLDADTPTVRIAGKGDKERVVPLGPHTVGAVRSYRHQRQQTKTTGPVGVRPDRPVIISTNGDPVTASVLSTWIKHWLRAAEVAPRKGALAHAFRHTAADGWLANGATLAEVQALLGHASVGTTGIYTKVRSETLSDVVKAGRFENTRSAPRSPDVPR